jgi:phosphate acetyltransferase
MSHAGVRHEKYERLLNQAQACATIDAAVAHSCDDVSLRGCIEAAKLDLIRPVLVGPPDRMRAVADASGLNIGNFEIVTSAYSQDSAAKAVELVTAGRAEALMKGSLHTDELMGAVVSRQTGIRTARRISHCFIMDVPKHPTALIITDAAVNISPSLDDKVDIVQNAIDLAHAMKVSDVRVAILSAMETVTAKVPSTIEAAALCKMADRGQITGAILDGPSGPGQRYQPRGGGDKENRLACCGTREHPVLSQLLGPRRGTPILAIKLNLPAHRTAVPDAVVPWPSSGLCGSYA